MATLKQLKKLLKKAGLKASGSKRALTRRAKKAHLLRGGQNPEPVASAPLTEEEKRDSERREATAAEKDREDTEARAMAAAEKPSPSSAKPGGFWRRRATRRLSKRAYRW